MVVCVACAACGRTAAAPQASSGIAKLIGGKFAGYLWTGNVTAIHGAWNVPSISSSSQDGHASTWIGAEAPGGSRAPFIQIGITEDRPLQSEPDAGVNSYTAFWSDVPHGFHPIDLFKVSPGDQILATMTLSGGDWHLSIVDRTSGRSRSFSTQQEADNDFNLAEWLQEDVTNARTNQAFPYPQMGTVHFSAMTVNDQTPQDSTLQSQWITTADHYYGTTPAHDGSFDVDLVSPTSVAGRYLDIAAPEDLAATGLSADLQPNSTVSEGLVVSQARTLARTMEQSAARFSSEHWPTDVAAQIVLLAKEQRYLAHRLEALRHPTRTSLESALAAPTPYGVEHQTAVAIHRELAIPFPE